MYTLRGLGEDTLSEDTCQKCLAFIPQIRSNSFEASKLKALATVSGNQHPICGFNLISAAVTSLLPSKDPTVTTNRLTAAGEILLNYAKLSLPNPVGGATFDEDTVRVQAVQALVKLGLAVNRTRALDFLAQAIERGERSSVVVGEIIRAIPKLLNSTVLIDIRNRAVAAVGQVASVGSAIYGDFAPGDAARIYQQINNFLAKPDPVELCVLPVPTPAPTDKDTVALQKALNRVAPFYGLVKVPTDGWVNDATLIAATTLAGRFTTSPKAASVYFELKRCPTATSVATLAPRLARDLNGLASQLGGNKHPILVASLAFAGVSGVLWGSYWLYNRRTRQTFQP